MTETSRCENQDRSQTPVFGLHPRSLARRLLTSMLRRIDGEPADSGAIAAPSELRIEVVADPDQTMHLIGVTGQLRTTTIGSLAMAFAAIGNRDALHLDVSDAIVADAIVFGQFERLIDQLEGRGVRLRVVGLDPQHPVLSDNHT